MKALTCEMCGSTNIIKQDGVFICQSCGTKYSVEEAKKMMVEGTVDVKGTVKIDTSSELKNLYEVARRALDSENYENAAKYYDQILIKDPSSWEANFYVVYCQAMTCKIAEISSAANSISNCLPFVLELIKNDKSVEGDNKKLLEESTIEMIFLRVSVIANMLYQAANNHFNSIDINIKGNYTQEYTSNVSSATCIYYVFGDSLIENFGDKYGKQAAESWEQGIKLHNTYLIWVKDKQGNISMMNKYAEKIKKYNDKYVQPTPQPGACYVATSVYGSYDCPEVWILRRYRDFRLAETWYGRCFVKSYYAISPTLVKWFGETSWFKKLWRKKLDRWVQNLQEKGFSDSPYQDKEW